MGAFAGVRVGCAAELAPTELAPVTLPPPNALSSLTRPPSGFRTRMSPRPPRSRMLPGAGAATGAPSSPREPRSRRIGVWTGVATDLVATRFVASQAIAALGTGTVWTGEQIEKFALLVGVLNAKLEELQAAARNDDDETPAAS